jgi:hypothetical protein
MRDPATGEDEGRRASFYSEGRAALWAAALAETS